MGEFGRKICVLGSEIEWKNEELEKKKLLVYWVPGLSIWVDGIKSCVQIWHSQELVKY